jgi:hypothetical protein
MTGGAEEVKYARAVVYGLCIYTTMRIARRAYLELDRYYYNY